MIKKLNLKDSWIPIGMIFGCIIGVVLSPFLGPFSIAIGGGIGLLFGTIIYAMFES